MALYFENARYALRIPALNTVLCDPKTHHFDTGPEVTRMHEIWVSLGLKLAQLWGENPLLSGFNIGGILL